MIANQYVVIKITQPNSKWPPQKLIKAQILLLLEKSQFMYSYQIHLQGSYGESFQV